jgi:hypothetical protein
MPPTKAPSAIDSPLCAVNTESPTTIHSVVSTSSFVGADLRGGIVDAGHQLLPQPDQQGEDGYRLRCRHAQRTPQVVAGGGQCRQQDQAGRHGEVLEQQHAHGLPPGTRVEFEAVGQHFCNDGGRGHRHRQAHRDAAAPALFVEDRRCEAGAQGRQRHLRRAEAEHQCAHGLQALQAEFEADREHQEDDAELGEALNFRAFLEQREAVRSERHADRQVGEHARQPEATHERHCADGGGKQEQERKQVGVHRRIIARRYIHGIDMGRMRARNSCP